MNKVTLIKTVQEIAESASRAPHKPGEVGRKINELSPHFERLSVELIRRYVIQNTQMAGAQIAHELLALRELIPEKTQPQFDLTAARINQILQTIYQS